MDDLIVTLSNTVSQQFAILKHEFAGVLEPMGMENVKTTLGSSKGQIFDNEPLMKDACSALKKGPYRFYMYVDPSAPLKSTSRSPASVCVSKGHRHMQKRCSTGYAKTACSKQLSQARLIGKIDRRAYPYRLFPSNCERKTSGVCSIYSSVLVVCFCEYIIVIQVQGANAGRKRRVDDGS